MKLICFCSMHPLSVCMYYFFLLIIAICYNELILVSSIFFEAVILNWLCGCFKQTIDFIKYFFVLAIIIFIGKAIFLQPISIFDVKNFILFCTSTILFFSFNKIINGRKFMYLVGGISPHIALILKICTGYIFLLQKRVKDFIDVNFLSESLQKKIKLAQLVMIKIFDWGISDCLRMVKTLRSRNYSGRYFCYSAYKMSWTDFFFTGQLIFWVSAFFLVSKFFLLGYLFLPFSYDLFCYIRFLVREERND